MPRRTQRLIATLLVWIAMLMTVGIVVSRIATPEVYPMNAWYPYGGMVTGTDPETANRLMQQIGAVTDGIWDSGRSLAMEYYGMYAVWLIAIVAILLMGGVAATYFIWRSAQLPDSVEQETPSVMAAGKRRLLEDADESAEMLRTNQTSQRQVR